MFQKVVMVRACNYTVSVIFVLWASAHIEAVPKAGHGYREESAEDIPKMACCKDDWIGKPSALLDLPAQPSGTENIYKIYVASFHNESQLNVIIREAQEIVSNAFGQV
jgi:hypothetical protein